METRSPEYNHPTTSDSGSERTFRDFAVTVHVGACVKVGEGELSIITDSIVVDAVTIVGTFIACILLLVKQPSAGRISKSKYSLFISWPRLFVCLCFMISSCRIKKGIRDLRRYCLRAMPSSLFAEMKAFCFLSASSLPRFKSRSTR